MPAASTCNGVSYYYYSVYENRSGGLRTRVLLREGLFLPCFSYVAVDCAILRTPHFATGFWLIPVHSNSRDYTGSDKQQGYWHSAETMSDEIPLQAVDRCRR
jgi:hypothetical protein